jgi:hypothetical protein
MEGPTSGNILFHAMITWITRIARSQKYSTPGRSILESVVIKHHNLDRHARPPVLRLMCCGRRTLESKASFRQVW